MSVLNATLVERAPKDPPPPRRSRRSGVDEPETPKKGKSDAVATKSPDESDAYRSVPSKLELAQEEDVLPDKDKMGGKRKRNARNVGGWVSPQFAEEIDRFWLENDSAVTPFELAKYIPQVGDTVL
jgi:hypothetical protein